MSKCGAPTFHIGGPGADSPCLADGDTYSAITKSADPIRAREQMLCLLQELLACPDIHSVVVWLIR